MNALVKPPLNGELLAPDDLIDVVFVQHPLQNHRVYTTVPTGSTLRQIVDFCKVQYPTSRVVGGLYIELNGTAIEVRLWHLVRPKGRCHVLVRTVPRGFIVPMLATAIGGALGIAGSQLAMGILTAVISIGLNFLMSALFAPSQEKAETFDPAYSISGPKNRINKWGPVPSVLGRTRMAALYASSPYNEFSGNDQYIRLLLVWGYGPLTVDQIKIGDTNIADYSEVEIQTRNGYVGDARQTLYTREAVQEDYSISVRRDGSPYVRETAEDAVEIHVDFAAVNGIYKDGKKGPAYTTVEMRVEYKLASAPNSAYQPFPTNGVADIVFAGDSPEPIRRTYRRAVPAGKYSIRVRRLREDDQTEAGHSTNVVWTALRIFRNSAPIEFDKPLAISAIRIKASDELNGVPDDINARVTARMQVWDGSAWTTTLNGAPAISSNPADLFRHVLQGPANKRPVPTSMIDLVGLQGFHAYCRRKGFRFDMARDFKRSVFETLRDVAAAGRGAPLIKDGRWSVVWEDDNAPIVQHFTPVNSWNMQWEQEYRELPHGLRCKFLNAEKGYIEDERIVYADGYSKSNATILEQVEFPGVCYSNLIYKMARYRLAEAKLRPARYTLMVDASYLVCQFGDRVVIGHDVLLFGLASGRIVSVDGQTITLDQALPLLATETYAIRFAMPDGSSLLRSIERVQESGEYDTLTLVGSGTVPTPKVMYSIGPAGRETQTLRVKRIQPMSDVTAELELTADAPEIQNADDGPIPEYESGIVPPTNPRQFPPYNLRASETVEVRSGVPLYVTTVLFDSITELGATSYAILAERENYQPRRVDSQEEMARFENLPSGVWTFRALARTPGGNTAYSQPLRYTVLGERAPAIDPGSFDINAIGDVAVVKWAEPGSAVERTEIRYSPATAGATWNSAVPILTDARGVSAQVPFMSGTYLLKHVSYGGVYSVNPLSIVVTNAGEATRNVVEEVFESYPFDGTHQNTIGTASGLELLSGYDIFAEPDIFAVPEIFVGDAGFIGEGYYTLPDVTDLGEVFTSRVSMDVVAFGVNYVDDVFTYADIFALDSFFGANPDDWAVEVEVSTTVDDPAGTPTWSDWSRVVVGDYTARAFRFRAHLMSTTRGVTPRIALLHFTIDMPDRVHAGNDIAVPTAGLRVNFDPPFRALQGISRNDQNLATGEYAIVTNQSETGFDIRYRNAAGTFVARTFDFVAKGYGRRIS